MLQIEYLYLVQFKNYAGRRFPFEGRITGICGKNGMGKTNLLDALYYCCFGKSYFCRSDAQLVLRGAGGFRLEAGVRHGGEQEKLVCVLRETGRKELSLNDEPYSRLADHVGRYPCVIIAPDDVDIITGGSEARRRFMDGLLSQTDPEYLTRLMTYNKVLQQRNSLLRQSGAAGRAPDDLLSVYDSQLLAPAAYVHAQRRQVVPQLLQQTLQFYERIAGHHDDLSLRYESELNQCSLQELLLRSRSRDMALQRSTTGIHRDELILLLDGQPFKSLASQGQRKSLLFALKLAAFDLLTSVKGFAPLLLLDDVFEKLDAGRMHNLLDFVCRENDGQVFITDTHADRIQQHLDEIGATYQLINLDQSA